MDKIIEKLITGTQKRLSILEALIFNSVVGYFVDNLSLKDDVIKYNTSNVSAINKLSSDVVGSSSINKISKFILKGIATLLSLTAVMQSEYDTTAVKKSEDVFNEVNGHATKSVNSILSLEVIFADIKQEALILMSDPNGISLRDLRRIMKNKVVDNGIAQRYFSRWTNDIYSQYQRVGANNLRKKLGLKYAIYQGGEISNTRSFCRKLNGTVVTDEEIQEWDNKTWAGKNEVGYNPITDLGGYNCRHRLDWISEELAKKLRPDLA